MNHFVETVEIYFYTCRPVPLLESVKEREGQIFSPESPGADQPKTFQQRCVPQRATYQLKESTLRTEVVIFYQFAISLQLNNTAY